jgi:hypothetical protein
LSCEVIASVTKKVTPKNHNLLLFTNTENGKSKSSWDELVKLTSREKWEKPIGHKDVGTPVDIDGDQGAALRFEQSQFRKVELPPEFCPMCEDTHVPAEKRIARGFIMLDREYPEVKLKPKDTITHCVCEDCAEKLAWPDPNNNKLYLTRTQEKNANRAFIVQNCISYIKARQMAGETGSVLGTETRKEAAKDRMEEIV